MKNILICCVFLTVFDVFSLNASEWHDTLSLGNGGWWHNRIPVEIQNNMVEDLNGKEVGMIIGKTVGQIDLVGVKVEGLRVCNEKGEEMLYRITNADNRQIRKGKISAGGTLTIPVECVARRKVRYYIYFNNSEAWCVPDYLRLSIQGINGGFEQGNGNMPAGWTKKKTDNAHKISWINDEVHSGQKALKVQVTEGSKPNWVGGFLKNISVQSGVKYELRAWTKGENIIGQVGWFIHVMDVNGKFIVNKLITAGNGSFAWEKIVLAITIPPGGVSATIGTALYGTGTAWYDDLSFDNKKAEKSGVIVSPGKIQNWQIKEGLSAKIWEIVDKKWDRRVPVKVINYSTEELKNVIICVNINKIMRGNSYRYRLRVMDKGKELPFRIINQLLTFKNNVEAKSTAIYYIYLSSSENCSYKTTTLSATVARIESMQDADFRFASDILSDQVYVAKSKKTAIQAVSAIAQSEENLVKNGDFESGETMPDFWPGTAEKKLPEGMTFGFDNNGVCGTRSVKMYIPQKAKRDWVGWRQDVPVKSDRTYFFAGLIKCDDVKNGLVRIYAHLRRSNGEITKEREGQIAIGSGLYGSKNWTVFSGFLRIPSDVTIFQVHLTTNTSGTIWHDGVLLVNAIKGITGEMEMREKNSPDNISVWSVNAIIKVFRDDIPPYILEPAQISAARNEKEPLQLVVRSARDIREVTIVVDPPINAAGDQLSEYVVEVVGYVPVDYPTSYYRSKSEPWWRKVPTTFPSSDGWSGMWPDPLLPQSKFHLKANTTQPFWVTFNISRMTKPGLYGGYVRLKVADNVLKIIPFKIKVWDFSLPEEHHFSAIYDLHFTTRWDIPGKTREQSVDQFMTFMAAHRISPNRVPVEPIFAFKDGSISVDFTKYDNKAERYFNELKFKYSYTPSIFNIFGWAHPPKPILGIKPYGDNFVYKNTDRAKLSPEYKRVYQECLRLYWIHMQEKGWADRIILYISDEPHFRHKLIREQMKALCKMIHAVNKNIPIYSSTWRHCEDWDGYLDVWGVGHYGCFPTETMRKKISVGERIWFTTDGQMSLDTPYCAIERLLPHYAFKFGVEAYEFWGINWLTYNPYDYGWHRYIRQANQPDKYYYIRYPNGDGYLAYPGAAIGINHPVSSIRIEQVREGMEDYEYLYLLRSKIKSAKTNGQDASVAEKTMQTVQRLVKIPNAGGKYSSKILPEPKVIFMAKEALAQAIESLREK